MSTKSALIVFIRNPVISRVKTRIALTHGAEMALQIYEQLLEITRLHTSSLQIDKYLFYSESILNDNWSNEIYHKRTQSGNDLGERMKNAFTDILKKHDNAIIIGSDCPYITSELIQTGFAEWENKEVVIGPAIDGGYYLLGMSTLLPFLFDNMPWSTDQLTNQTIKILNQNHCGYAILPKLNDVDEYLDWENYLNHR